MSLAERPRPGLSFNRLIRLAGGFALGMAACLPMPTFAQDYPSKPMKIISPYPPGGGTDVMARSLAAKFGERFGQTVTVENRGGASSTIGSAVVAKAPPDGYTMLLTAAGYASVPTLYPNLPYDHVRDLAPVSQLCSGPLILVVHPSMPANSVKELIALAKARPGEINYGSSGTGSFPHLTFELFSVTSGTKFTHVPYKGAGAAQADVLAGRVPAYFMNLISSVPHIRAGKLRALGVSSIQRSSMAPDLPTIAESGLPGFDMTSWYGFMVTAGTPREVINKLHQEVVRALNASDVKERLSTEGLTVVASPPDQFAEFLSREIEKYARVIKAAGIKATDS